LSNNFIRAKVLLGEFLQWMGSLEELYLNKNGLSNIKLQKKLLMIVGIELVLILCLQYFRLELFL